MEKIKAQQEHLKKKYVGTGTSDTTKHEWAVNHHRDSYASYIGHYPMLMYMSMCLNQTVFETRLDLIHKMVEPCGPPPKKKKKQTKPNQ